MIGGSTTAVVVLTGKLRRTGFDLNRVRNWKASGHGEVRDNAQPDEKTS